MCALGFEAAPVGRKVEMLPMEDWRARTVRGRQLKALRTIRARAPHDSEDLRGAIESVRPEALIVDVLAGGALAVAASWDGPWSCYRSFPLPPSRAALRLLGIAGPLAKAPLHLYMSAPPFERPSENQPGNLVMVGPCSWEPAGEPPPALAEPGDPLVLVSTSSEFQVDGALVETALKALAGEPFHVVATMPSMTLPELEVPGNASVLTSCPHTPILRRAACAITHGGMGATQKALTVGVPVCVVPHGRDQYEVARRVEAAGAGTRLASRRLSPARLRLKALQAIGCRPGAEQVARGFLAAAGAEAAADAIERRLLV